MKKAAISACNDDIKLMKKSVLKHALQVIKNDASQKEIIELAKLKNNQSKQDYRCATIGGLLCPAHMAKEYNDSDTFKRYEHFFH